MQPIISPWLFYVAAIANKVVLASFLMAMTSFFISLICFLHEDEGVERQTTIKWFKAGIIAIVIAIIIPDGDTVYKMIAASMVTPDNIDMGKDYIIQCIKEAADAMR